MWTQTHGFELKTCVNDISNSWQGEGSLCKGIGDNNLPFDAWPTAYWHWAVSTLEVILPQCGCFKIGFIHPLSEPTQSSMEREDPKRAELRTQSYTLLLQQGHTLFCFLHRTEERAQHQSKQLFNVGTLYLCITEDQSEHISIISEKSDLQI